MELEDIGTCIFSSHVGRVQFKREAPAAIPVLVPPVVPLPAPHFPLGPAALSNPAKHDKG